jgi:hypothetical protein
MVKIEKILTKLERPEKVLPPGYVDVFHSNPDTYMAWHYRNLKKLFLPLLPNSLQIGLEYGIQGKPILEILTEEPSDTLWEIDYITLLTLSKKLLKALLKDHRVIVAQLMESGIFNLDNDREDIVTNLRANYEIRDLIEHGAGPMFALFTHNHVSDEYPNKKFAYEPKTLALVPARKPRDNRVKFIAKLYEQGMLDDCDWSLTYVEDPPHPESIMPGDGHFFKSINVNALRFTLLNKTEEPYLLKFYKDNIDILPKSFDMPNKLFSDTNRVREEWFGSYTFKIALETQSHNVESQEHFLTEKTFKGFMLGLPTMVLGPSGMEQTVKDMGFEFYDFEYDHLDGDERSDKMISCLKQEHDLTVLKEIAKRNFTKMWDKNFLLDLVVKRFKNKD